MKTSLPQKKTDKRAETAEGWGDPTPLCAHDGKAVQQRWGALCVGWGWGVSRTHPPRGRKQCEAGVCPDCPLGQVPK